VKDHVREQSGILLRDNVHGIDVFPDNPNVRIGHFSSTGTVLAAPDPFLADINRYFGVVENASQRTIDIVLLLNYALMRPEPVAQIVFAFSAVRCWGKTKNGVLPKNSCSTNSQLPLRTKSLDPGGSGMKLPKRSGGECISYRYGRVYCGS
jgi:hypothetical protein